MFNKSVIFLVLGLAMFASMPCHSQQLLESYQAYLSDRDHFNSNGQRLTTAAAIIRQDRANFHRFGLRDPGDENEDYFADENNRATLERALSRGQSDPETIARIVNGTPLVRVEVYRGNVGDFVTVHVVNNGATTTTGPQLLESYQAFLSERDHFNSDGQRLTTVAAIIRQDRANFHRYNLRDQGDEYDVFFADMGNRAILESLLERGRAEPGVISRIVNGTALVRVQVFRGSNGPFINVTVLD